MSRPTKSNAKSGTGGRQVRDQDGVAQGKSGDSGYDPRTQSRGQGAHDYSKQDSGTRERDEARRQDRITPAGEKVKTPFN